MTEQEKKIMLANEARILAKEYRWQAKHFENIYKLLSGYEIKQEDVIDKNQLSLFEEDYGKQD